MYTAGVAQLVERQLPKLQVASSRLVSRSQSPLEVQGAYLSQNQADS
jgi:hypothetical protein